MTITFPVSIAKALREKVALPHRTWVTPAAGSHLLRQLSFPVRNLSFTVKTSLPMAALGHTHLPELPARLHTGSRPAHPALFHELPLLRPIPPSWSRSQMLAIAGHNLIASPSIHRVY